MEIHDVRPVFEEAERLQQVAEDHANFWPIFAATSKKTWLQKQ